MTEPSFRLLLIRHAKAEDGDVDFERPLTRRGRRDAGALGTWLAGREMLPDLAVVSPARRAQQTWEAASAALEPAPPEVTDGRIYDNDPAGLLDIVRQSGAEVSSIALVGHNPSMEELARLLDDGTGDHRARAQLSAGLPTCTVAVFSLGVPAAELLPGTARLTHFFTARS